MNNGKIILYFDYDKRINLQMLEEMVSAIINYLYHDFEYFEDSYEYDENENEIEIPAIKINWRVEISGI